MSGLRGHGGGFVKSSLAPRRDWGGREEQRVQGLSLVNPERPEENRRGEGGNCWTQAVEGGPGG